MKSNTLFKLICCVICLIIIITFLTLNLSSTIFGASDKNPIVMVHGLGGSGSNFLSIQSYLSSEGWSKSEMSALNLPSKSVNNSLNANAISKEVDSLLSKTGASEVDIIAHSMGGANSLYYIKNMQASGKVDKLVTLGGANRLVTSTAPSGVDTTSITGTSDMIVTSSLSKLSGANNVSVTGVSHIALLSNSQVKSLIKSALSGDSSSNNETDSTDKSSTSRKYPSIDFSKYFNFNRFNFN